MIVPLCAAIALAPQAITYRTTGATASAVVKMLADRTGEKLAVADSLAGEVLVVRVDAVEPEQLRNRIAECLAGKWTDREGTLTLIADGVESDRRRRAAQKAFAERALALIAPMREWSAGFEIQTGSIPLDIFEKLSRAEIESLLPDDRVVYSTNPNTQQRRLPDVSKVIEAQAAEHQLSRPVRVLLVLERSGLSDHVRMTYGGYDEVGRRVGYQMQSLISFEKAAAPSREGKEIAWSAVSSEIAAHYGNWTPQALDGTLELSQSAIDSLSKPTEIDPLSYGFGEGMLAVADDFGANVVASIGDDDARGPFGCAQRGMTTGEFWARVQRSKVLTSSRESGWIVVSPKDPIYARSRRGDRIALETLIKKQGDSIWPSLNDLAAFANAHPVRETIPYSFGIPFHVLVGFRGTADVYPTGLIRPLQFFGHLSVADRQRLNEGIRVSALSPKAQGVLRAFLYSASASYNGSGREIEPTDFDWNAIVSNGVVTARVEEMPLIVPLPDGGTANVKPIAISPRQLAMEKWENLHHDNPYRTPKPEPHRVKVGSRKVYEFRLMLGDNEMLDFSLADDHLVKSAKPTTMNEIDASVRRAIDSAYEKYLKEMGGGLSR